MVIPFLHHLVRRHLSTRGFHSKRITVGNVLVHYYESEKKGNRETLILVHGLGTSTTAWIHILPALAQRYHVIAPDLPGFGFSLSEDGFIVRSLDRFVDTIEHFFDIAAPESFFLLGHSLGGWITMKYALRHPDRVKHLVLVNTAGIYTKGSEELVEAFDLRSTRDTRMLLDRIWKRYPWYFRPFTPFVFEDLVRRKVPGIVAGIQERDFMNSDLHRLRMPVGVIWGEEDRLLSMETVKILEERLPARTIHTIQSSGHVPHLEAPSEFLHVLDTILQERVL